MAAKAMSSLNVSDPSGSNNGRARSSSFSFIVRPPAGMPPPITGWPSSSDSAIAGSVGASFPSASYGGYTALSSSLGAFAPYSSPSSFFETSYRARQEQRQAPQPQASNAPIHDGSLVRLAQHQPREQALLSQRPSTRTAIARSEEKMPQETIDAYATFLLKRNSPEEVRSSIYESLGPYITSIMRKTAKRTDPSSGLAEENVSKWFDYENVLELILEHCSMTSRDVATQTLQEIYRAVRAGVVPLQFLECERDNEQRIMFQGILDSILGDSPDQQAQVQQQGNQEDSEDAVDDTELEMLVGHMMLDEEDEHDDEQTKTSALVVSKNTGNQVSNTPLSSYLLADVEREDTEAIDSIVSGTSSSNSPISASNEDPSVVNKNHPPRPRWNNPKEHKKRNKVADDIAAKDLAAALFKPSRPRSNSNLSDTTGKRNPTTSPRLLPQANHAMTATPPIGSFTMDSGYYSSNNLQDQFVAQQIDVTAEVLLTMQSDLSTDAALAASMMAYGDVNVAYYLIEQALHAPPVCRHMLQYTCYRADCAFSHDVDGHTCTFWLRGRCGKGDQCRFLHGFNSAVLEGMDLDSLSSGGFDHTHGDPSGGAGSIVTQNLLWHNEKRKKEPTSGNSGSPFSSISPPPGLDPDFSVFSLPKAVSTKADNTTGSVAVSFARITANTNPPSTGAGLSTSSPLMGTSSTLGKPKEKIIKIPQELWTSSINRDSSVFHIADPIERYYAVNNPQNRAKQAIAGLPFVMDLHYQSVKTAPVVLASLLPQKLEESQLQQEKGVWIITGSGHHVNAQSHQKRNGVLESAVLKWLLDEGYEHFRGKDRNGNGGAIYVACTETGR